MEYDDLITLAETLSKFIDRSEATISNKCAGHARLFSRLRQGQGCGVDTYKNALLFFSDNWPEDLAWPKGINRPAPTKKKVA
jgi:hypothetical protein